MSAQSIEAQVKQLIVEQLGVEESDLSSLDASFSDDLGADSLDLVEFVMALEEKFKLSIPDEEVESITTVREAIECIEKHQEGASGKTDAGQEEG